MEKSTIRPIDIHGLPSNIKGVYIMMDENNEPIYIGRSNDSIRGRLIHHFKTKFSMEYVFEIQIIVLESQEEIEQLETQLISTHKPKYNYQIKQTHDLFLQNRKYMDFDVLAKLDEHAIKHGLPKHQIINEALSMFFKE
jgi:excinuclease UvrABC nuclease subunit